jgi:hypothetical protein
MKSREAMNSLVNFLELYRRRRRMRLGRTLQMKYIELREEGTGLRTM